MNRTDSEGGDYTPLWILPEDHPSQARMPANEREARRAADMGAVPVEGADHWRVDAGAADPGDAKYLARCFGTRAAMNRYRRAMADPDERASWRFNAARAANDEVRANGRVPVREVPDEEAPMSERRYFFTTREDTPYSYKLLDAKAEEIGVPLQIDRSDSPYRGLRFTVGEVPEELEGFRSEEARAAREASERGDDVSAVAGLAESAFGGVRGGRRGRRMPITAPKPERAPGIHENVRAGLAKLPDDKLVDLVHLTRGERDGIREQERVLEARGLELPADLKSQYGMFARGAKLGEQILREERGLDPDGIHEESGRGRAGRRDDGRGSGGRRRRHERGADASR